MNPIIKSNEELALRCHDISTSLGNKSVVEFDLLSEIGLMVRLALHIRGLSRIEYKILQLVSNYYLQISNTELKIIIQNLAEIEFIRIVSEGSTIKYIIPTVPYYDDLYDITGEFAKTKRLNEAEELAITILSKLTGSPVPKNSLIQLGADKKLLDRSLQIGDEGNYLIIRRCRGKEIVLSPVFFSENADIYSDLVAKSGAKSVERILNLIKQSQGIPLSVIEATREINQVKITDDEINLLKRLATDGAVKPPIIQTSHSGTNHFIFTPRPGNFKLSRTKREIYERAMALVSAVLQGQYLPKEHAIRNPLAILQALKDRGYLNASTESYEQYKNLMFLKVGRLELEQAPSWYRFVLNDTEENNAALDMAISLVSEGSVWGLEIDDDARIALGKDQIYLESLIGSRVIREREQIPLSDEHQEQIDNLFLGSV